MLPFILFLIFERFVEEEAENKCQVVVVFYVRACFGDYFTIIYQRKMCIPLTTTTHKKTSFFRLFKTIIFLFGFVAFFSLSSFVSHLVRIFRCIYYQSIVHKYKRIYGAKFKLQGRCYDLRFGFNLTMFHNRFELKKTSF